MSRHIFTASAGDSATAWAKRAKYAMLRGFGFTDVKQFLNEHDGALGARKGGNYLPGQAPLHQEMMGLINELYESGNRDAAAALIEPDLRDDDHLEKLRLALVKFNIIPDDKAPLEWPKPTHKWWQVWK